MTAAGAGGPRSLVVTGVGVVDADGFDFRTALGRRGYKYLPAASQYFLAAAKRALAHAGEGSLTAADPQARGAAVGTNSAAAALHDAMDRTVIGAGAAELSPLTAPYFSVNLFGSRLATEHALKAFNLTFTSPRVAGLEALQTGLRAVAAGRAGWLLAGATEEALPPHEPGAKTSEAGAVALVLEPARAVAARGGLPRGRVAVRTFFLPPREAASARGAEAAGELLADALAALGPGGGAYGPYDRPGQSGPYSQSGPYAPSSPYPPRGPFGLDGLDVTAVLDDSAVGRAVAAALGEGARTVPAGAGCLAPVLRVAGALGPEGGDGRPRAVVTAAAEGNAAVCLIVPETGQRSPGPPGTPASSEPAESR
ncbi:beta-ketoacyl synthase N-terminal-like domain-containing protein [Streptomyces sp. B1866]|uniref:beta-ketoacyl synthase N-terminal-like domain-containing protein n=1 Tax=Streptomyces sp. B1866 TaxID=3075431 RepID=UPI002891642C|nr:beta-ketoacyl synthase N-terminal-like domain-containing protein [Streptomyces sp. B1866]MDT3399149.1 beta-ketoacyl synthase N-terminal-like domain-containing protein [Streptomyces sp. B1866]